MMFEDVGTRLNKQSRIVRITSRYNQESRSIFFDEIFSFFFCLKVHWNDIQVFRKFVVTIKQYLTASVRSFSASEQYNDAYFAHYLRAIIMLCQTRCFRDKCRNTYYQTRVITRTGNYCSYILCYPKLIGNINTKYLRLPFRACTVNMHQLPGALSFQRWIWYSRLRESVHFVV